MALLFLSTAPSVRAADDPLIDAYLQGVDLYRKGDLDAAIPQLRKAAKLSEQRFGPESPELALDLNNLAEALRRRGDLNEAEKLLRRAYAIDQQQDDQDTLAAAATLNNLGLVLSAKGQKDQALAANRAALAAVEKALGTDHPDTARAAYNLALAEAAAGNLDVARALAARAAFVAERALGDRHPVTRQMQATAARLRATPDQPGGPAARSGMDVAAAVPAVPRAARRAPSAAPVDEVEPAAAPVVRAARPAQQRTGEPAAGGGERSFAVQLMALRDEAGLEDAWRDLRRRYQRLETAQRLPTTHVDIEGRGRFYRLLVGPYTARADAEAFCGGLKQDGGDCRVIIRN